MADSVIAGMGRRLGGARLLLIVLPNLIPAGGLLSLGCLVPNHFREGAELLGRTQSGATSSMSHRDDRSKR